MSLLHTSGHENFPLRQSETDILRAVMLPPWRSTFWLSTGYHAKTALFSIQCGQPDSQLWHSTGNSSNLYRMRFPQTQLSSSLYLKGVWYFYNSSQHCILIITNTFWIPNGMKRKHNHKISWIYKVSCPPPPQRAYDSFISICSSVLPTSLRGYLL